MADRPTRTLEWATDGDNIVPTPGGIIQTGYTQGAIPSPFNFNDQLKLTGEWVQYLDEQRQQSLTRITSLRGGLGTGAFDLEPSISGGLFFDDPNPIAKGGTYDTWLGEIPVGSTVTSVQARIYFGDTPPAPGNNARITLSFRRLHRMDDFSQLNIVISSLDYRDGALTPPPNRPGETRSVFSIEVLDEPFEVQPPNDGPPPLLVGSIGAFDISEAGPSPIGPVLFGWIVTYTQTLAVPSP